MASSIGIGTYLGECDDTDDARYASAARAALERGINVFDASINYRCQRSERTLGAVLRDAIAAGVATRDEVIVCTKGGYIPLESSAPQTREEYLAYLQRTFVDTGIVSADDVVGGGHALSPSFLAHQIKASQANLGVRTLDVYYLHNPEQQLDSVQPARFRTILRRAFTLLEEQVQSGDIGCYGCATWNGLRTPPDTQCPRRFARRHNASAHDESFPSSRRQPSWESPSWRAPRSCNHASRPDCQWRCASLFRNSRRIPSARSGSYARYQVSAARWLECDRSITSSKTSARRSVSRRPIAVARRFRPRVSRAT